MKKLAIFDLDGTLVDSITDVALCFNDALSLFGFAMHPIKEYVKFIGGDLEQVISKLLSVRELQEENINRVKSKYRELYLNSMKPNTKPYPGIYQLLDELIKNDKTLAINTNKSQTLTENLVKELFSGYPFLDVIGYREGSPAKPDPYGVNAILTKAHLLPGEALYIGDGENDIATAQAAGVSMVFVTWGQGTAVKHDDSRISKVVSSPQEILTYMMEAS